MRGTIAAPVTTTLLRAGPNYNCVAFNKRVSTCSARQRKAGDPGFDPTNNYLGYGTSFTLLVYQFSTGECCPFRGADCG